MESIYDLRRKMPFDKAVSTYAKVLADTIDEVLFLDLDQDKFDCVFMKNLKKGLE